MRGAKRRRDQRRKVSSKFGGLEGMVVMLRKADSRPRTCVFSSIAESDGGSFIYTVPVH